MDEIMHRTIDKNNTVITAFQAFSFSAGKYAGGNKCDLMRDIQFYIACSQRNLYYTLRI